jgi:hypothetical protein
LTKSYVATVLGRIAPPLRPAVGANSSKDLCSCRKPWKRTMSGVLARLNMPCNNRHCRGCRRRRVARRALHQKPNGISDKQERKQHEPVLHQIAKRLANAFELREHALRNLQNCGCGILLGIHFFKMVCPFSKEKTAKQRKQKPGSLAASTASAQKLQNANPIRCESLSFLRSKSAAPQLLVYCIHESPIATVRVPAADVALKAR